MARSMRWKLVLAALVAASGLARAPPPPAAI